MGLYSGDIYSGGRFIYGVGGRINELLQYSNTVFKTPSIHSEFIEKKLKLLLMFSFHVPITLAKDPTLLSKSELLFQSMSALVHCCPASQK